MGQFAWAGAILGVGVIGLWLLGGKKSTTSAPDSMPELNSGLRGTTMPITFGTNKVAAQVTWSKNWNPQRQRSSGKGKGGGSGGFGSAKGGGAAGQQYIYYWDLMFHYGMFDVPSAPNRGWVGADTIDPIVMDALTSGFASSLSALIPISTLVDNKSATLSYTEAFIGTALPTGDPDLTSWSHFVAEEGVNCAFPYTGWIGFDQLELGQTPTVPQLFMEWVPTSATSNLFPDGQYLSTTPNGDGTNLINNSYCKDANDQLYIVTISVSGSATVTVDAIDGSTSSTLTEAQFITDGSDLGIITSGLDIVIGVPGTKYFYAFDQHAAGGGFNSLIGIAYRINTDGTITRLGGFKYAYGSSSQWLEVPQCVYQMTAGEVVIPYSGLFASTNVAVLPDPFNYEDNHTDTGSFNSHILNISELNLRTFFDQSGFDPEFLRAGIIPSDNPGVARMFCYVGPGMMAFSAANPGNTRSNGYIESICATYPDGAMIEVDLNISGGIYSYTFIGVNNSYFKNADGTDAVPFNDRGLDSTGAAGSTDNDYYSPVPYKDAALVMIGRRYTDQAYDLGVRVFLNDGTQATEIIMIQSTFATTSDIDVVSNRNPRIIGDNNGIYVTVEYRTSAAAVHRANARLGGPNEGSLDVTPAYIIYRILTHPAFGLATSAIFGFTVTEARINQASYLAAVAECESQGCRISVTYDNTSSVLDIINDLLSLYGGYLTENDGIISFGVVTATETPVRTLNNHHLVAERGKPPVRVTKAALDDGYNKVSLSYMDRSLDYNQNQIIQSDEVDMDINGPRPKDWNTKYVMPGSLANQIVTRALWSNLYGRDTYEFTTGWKDFDLRPGDLVTLVDSFDTSLSAGARIRLMKRGATDKPGQFKWQAVQDYQHINQASAVYTQIASISGGAGSVVEPAVPPMWQTAYEVTREFQGAEPDVFFAYGQGSYVMGAQLYISLDGTNYLLSQDQQPYPITGIIPSSLEARPNGFVEEKVDFWLFPTSPFNASTPTFVQDYTLDDVTAAIREAGGGVLIVGSEAMSIQELTLLGQNHYRASRVFRGWGGTPISGHSSGEHFHAHGAGIFAHQITEDQVGTTLSYKIAPYNFAGKLVDVTSLTASSYTIRGDYWLARNQPFTRLWVNSAIAQPRSLSLKGPFVGVTSGGCDLIASWPLADNVEGFGAGGFGAGSFGHFIMSDSVAWRVDVYSSNGVSVSSFVVNTGYFDYTLAQNSTDFNGFGRNLVLRVTPFTVKGDGPVTDTRSVSLNW